LDEADTARLETMTQELSTAVQEVIVRAQQSAAEPTVSNEGGTDVVDEEVTEA